MGNTQAQQKKQAIAKKQEEESKKFSSVVSDQVCAFIVNPFPNLAGLEGQKLVFGADEYSEYMKKCISACKANLDGQYSLCSEEPAFQNAAEPLDSLSVNISNSKIQIDFDKQNILEGDNEEKLKIYTKYMELIKNDDEKAKEFKDSVEKESIENFMVLVSNYFILRRNNLFYSKALVLSALSPTEVSDKNLLNAKINEELKDFDTLAKKVDNDVKQFKAVHKALQTKQWRGIFGKSTLAQVADPSTTSLQVRPGNSRVFALNGTQLGLLRVKKFQLIEKYKSLIQKEQSIFDTLEMWRKGFGSLSDTKLTSPTFVLFQQTVMKNANAIPSFATQ